MSGVLVNTSEAGGLNNKITGTARAVWSGGGQPEIWTGVSSLIMSFGILLAQVPRLKVCH